MRVFDFRIFVLTLLLWFGSCNPGEPDPKTDSLDREPMLIHWVDNIILPSYQNFSAKFDAMQLKSNAFTSSPSASSLVDFRQAWVEAYVAWQKVELFEIG